MNAICPHCKNYGQYAQEPGTMVSCPVCDNLFHLPEEEAVPICPHCQHPLDRGDVVCVKCGYHLEQKTLLDINIDKEAGDVPFWLQCLRFVYGYFPGLFRPITVILAILATAFSLLLTWLGFFIMGFGAFFEGFFVLCFALLSYGQGVAFIVSGDVSDLKSAIIEFDKRQLNTFLIIVFGTLVFAFFAVMIFLRLCELAAFGR